MLDSVYNSPTYNSYVATVADMDTYMQSLAGLYDLTNWNNLSTIINVSSVNVASGIATADAPNHGRSNGDVLIIAGANPSELDGSKTITVLDANTFTYSSTSPDGAATGVITATYSDDVTKQNLILGATNDMNMFDFVGALTQGVSSPYNMKWPRTGTMYVNGVQIGNTEIPTFVFDYLAKRIVEKQADIQDGVFYDGRIKKQKLGKLELEFHNPRDSRLLVKSLKTMPSFQCIAPYVTNSSGALSYLSRS